MEINLVSHTGGCHCGAVKFEVIAETAPTSKYQKCYYHKQYFQLMISVVHCNCSICWMKQNHHFIVPKEQFKLLEGEDNLTLYTFNTGAAK